MVLNDGKHEITEAVETLPLQPVQNLTDFYAVEELFEKLVHTWNAKLPGYEFISKTLLQELLIAIMQNIKRQNPNYAASLRVEKGIQ
ncbi:MULTISPECIES: hypothetical protein [Dehalobacter]|uniref:Uncharacterized protein n=2 Tax=Dehalobacter restrictus TaxID=55583 RepID=A0A857DIE2_9FIRM|nr:MULTISPECIES: hypothetical protein [Dehalobacter]AHF11362.1 hypothetical protein DEHRE_08400 [Dehalobacter restrictus DSM 9455]MCG1025310.1 hypothetical protein [Dehalobacter sp.]MDJ0306161.1 hypothetical protein [Dehalobacter sp.]OCZ52000.1 hypothetical protein A7D23_11940 [Dehalobacter sp. TeCB1]QHA00697.1 hypothetical protein GQ588_08660 [Dehalobacter restrictus]